MPSNGTGDERRSALSIDGLYTYKRPHRRDDDVTAGLAVVNIRAGGLCSADCIPAALTTNIEVRQPLERPPLDATYSFPFVLSLPKHCKQEAKCLWREPFDGPGEDGQPDARCSAYLQP